VLRHGGGSATRWVSAVETVDQAIPRGWESLGTLRSGERVGGANLRALRATRSQYSRRKSSAAQHLAEIAGGIDPITVRLSDRRSSTGVKYVELRIGEGRGEVRMALLTPRVARQLAYRLHLHAAKADILKTRRRSG